MTAVESAAALLQRCRKVVVLSGAGMSTAAGIPDFRSPGGLYGNAAILLDRFTFFDSSKSAAWQRNMLEEDVRSALTLEFFSRNPLPYHEMRRGFIIGLGEGQWKLTLAHLLPELLNRNGKLELLASQNIDGLDHKVVSDKSKLCARATN
jgi:NAD-dependent SIR2 family protein deacetylase